MTRYIDPVYINPDLDKIKAEAVSLLICSGDPANYAAAVSAALVTIAVTSTDFTVADGATGRTLTCAEKTGTGAVAGTPAHCVFVTGSVLIAKAPCSSAGDVVVSDPYTIPSFLVWGIPQPVSP